MGTVSTPATLEGPTASQPAHPGLTEAEASAILDARGRYRRARTSRSYASIVRANVLTVFNAILAGFGAMTLALGDPRDALFLAAGRVGAERGERAR